MRWFSGITESMDMSVSKLWEMVIGMPGVLQSMRLEESDMTERITFIDSKLV